MHLHNDPAFHPPSTHHGPLCSVKRGHFPFPKGGEENEGRRQGEGEGRGVVKEGERRRGG